MIQINLVPERVRKKRSVPLNQFVTLYVLSVLLAGGIIGYLWKAQNDEIEALNGKLAKVKQEVAKYAQYDKMLKDLKAKKETVDKKRSIIRDLQKDRDVVVRMMALLSVQLPEQEMWFDRFTESGNTVTLNGVALSNEAIAEFMRNLESSPYIEKGTVNLTHSRQVVQGDMKLREFQITYRFFPFSQVQQNLKAQAS